MGLDPAHLTQTITAVGGLGTAAFGLVDALKGVSGSINRIGLQHIKDTVSKLSPDPPAADAPASNALPLQKILQTVEANWVNGTDLGSQKAIAKSLIKLHLGAGNAAAVATAASVDGTTLTTVAQKMVTGAPLAQAESDLYSRFDLIVTALLDEAYQISDQVYRNKTRLLAGIIAVLLALAGGCALDGLKFWSSNDLLLALLAGLLATPLAPIAKDLSSALATAVNTMQVVKKS
jgi:hypothetical protein